VRVVLDTNVLVSALLVPGGIPARVLRQFRDGLWELVISGKILEEYGEVLGRRKFALPVDLIAGILNEVEMRAIIIIPSKRYRAVRDPDDDEFIDVAVQAAADFLISGDPDLLVLKTFQGVAIVSPSSFLAQHPTP